MKNALLSLSTFALSLSTFAGNLPAQARRASDPPVRIWLSDDGDYRYGDRAKVSVQAQEDGYVVVFQVNTAGRIRPLFPLRPGDDNFVRGRKKVEIKGNADRGAFVVDDTTGRGTVMVAFSKSAFAFSAFERNGHWDYRAFADSTAAADPEAALLDVIQRMQPNERFEYDLANYVVASPRYARRPGIIWPYPGRGGYWWSDPYYGRSGLTVSLGIGSRFYRPYRSYSPYYYDPFYYSPVIRVPIGRWRY